MSKGNHGKYSKGIIDLIMLAGLISCAVSLSAFDKFKEELNNGKKVEDVFTWGAPHCIISLILIGIILIHIWQHRDFLKPIFSKNLYLKNKLTTLNGILLVLTIVSISLYLVGFTENTLHIHSMIVHVFVLIVVVHFIVNFKKLIKLFKKE